MPLDEQLHRAMPGSPFVEMGPRDPRVMSAPFDSRMGMDAPDYFSAMGSPPMGTGAFGSRPQRSSFPPGFEPDAMMSGPEQYVDELVRR
jgi:hypothetical protein